MKIIEWIKEHIIEIIGGIIIIFCSVVIIAGFFALAENESNRISEGIVIDKDYNSAYTQIIHRTVNDITVPYTIYHPESYQLQIQGEKDGEIVSYWFDCTVEEYHEYNIGDYYKK